MFKSLPKAPLKFYLCVLRAEKKHITFSLILGLLARVLAFVPILAFQFYLDDVLPADSYKNLLTFSLVFLYFVVIEIIISFLSGKLMAGMFTRTTVIMLERLTNQLLLLGKLELEALGIGPILQRFNELESIQKSFLGALFSLVIDIPILMVATALSLSISYWLTVVFYIQLFLIIIYNLFFQKKIKKVIGEQIDLKGAVDGLLIESINNKVKGNSDVLSTITSWQENLLSLADNSIKTSYLHLLLSLLISITKRCGYIGFLIVAYFMYVSGELSIGEIVSLGMISTHITGAGASLTNNIGIYQTLHVLLTKLEPIIKK